MATLRPRSPSVTNVAAGHGVGTCRHDGNPSLCLTRRVLCGSPVSLKQRVIRWSLVMVGVAQATGCASEPTVPQTSAVGGDIIVSGRGVRRIWSSQSETLGLGGFLMNDMALTSDGYLHMIYGYSRSGVNGSPATNASYRRKINISSGDTVATEGIPTALRTASLGVITVGCSSFGLVPYTDVLVYKTNRGIEGTPNWTTMPFFFSDGFSKAYASREASCVSNYVNPFDGFPYVIANLSINGVSQPNATKRIGNTTLTASVELSPAGVPLTFVMGQDDSLSVYNYATATRLSSVRIPMVAQYIPAGVLPSYRPDVYMVTKRNRAGTKVSGLIHNATARVCSSFVYDIASNTLTVKVQNAALNTNLFLTSTETFDDDGNVYYVSRFSATQINRITPAGGDQVYRSGFINGATSGSVAYLKHIDNRLFAAIVTPGSGQFSDDRGRGTLVITAVE